MDWEEETRVETEEFAKKRLEEETKQYEMELNAEKEQRASDVVTKFGWFIFLSTLAICISVVTCVYIIWGDGK